MTENSNDTTPCAVCLEAVRYTIKGHDVLRGVDLEIRRGEVMAVMGASGSGKTTILRLMMGLIRPQSGRIWVEGTEIGQLAEQDLLQVRGKMGFVFQNAALFDSLTVGENVAFGPIEHRLADDKTIARWVAEYLTLVGLEGTEKLMPSELSGGMRKRVGVARALIMRPTVMLYDEPTAGLDPPTAASLNELILSLRDRLSVTTVIVSHDVPALAQVADRVAVLDEGQILTVGSLEEMSRSELPQVEGLFLFWKGDSSR